MCRNRYTEYDLIALRFRYASFVPYLYQYGAKFKRVSPTRNGDLQLWLMQLWLKESISHRCMQLWLKESFSHRCIQLWLKEIHSCMHLWLKDSFSHSCIHLWLIDSFSHSCISHSCRLLTPPIFNPGITMGRQSPIDINGDVQPASLPALKIKFENLPTPLVAKNTGSTLHVECVGKVKGTLTGGPVGEEQYTLQQFHFHWGHNASQGSEHTINGKMYSAELHYVFKNEPIRSRYLGHVTGYQYFLIWSVHKYGSMNEAVTKPDGLAVAGVLLSESAEKSDAMPELFELLPKLDDPQSEEVVSDTIDLSTGLPNDRTYFTYPGSLTTPDYHECVTWIVFKAPVTLNSKHMTLMRDMNSHDGGKIENNWRAVQDLANRKISICSC
eukprot:sb/3465620/